MTTVLVAGGAGYVGAHVCMRLSEAGFNPVVYDNLSNGHREFVRWGPLEEGDILDTSRLEEVFAKHRPDAVLHFAGLIEVGESMRQPGLFYQNNVAGGVNLIHAARRASVGAFVFSSTCATYGEPVRIPMDEGHPQVPLNPYGWSKLMIEQVLKDLDRYEGFRSVILRYFNAAGADPKGTIGEWHDPETHAIPLAIRAARGAGHDFRILGQDYDTRDGTAVRDYIHVMDLADAHVLALKHLLSGGASDVFNLGTGTGTTVKELVAAIQEVAGVSFDASFEPRRPGDAPVLIADNSKARRVLGWQPRFGLREIVESAWRWHEGDAHR